jgi:fucose permease
MTAQATGTRSPTGARRLQALSYLSFVLIGWGSLVVPSLIRSIEHDFEQSDAGLGVFYFVSALLWASGGLASGLLTERIGRRLTLAIAGASMAVGLVGLALAPTWTLFVAAAVPLGFGCGAIDAGVNGLFLELHPGKGGALNLLHVFFSVGALGAPLAVGLVLATGVPWPAVPFLTAAVAFAVGALFATSEMPSGRQRPAAAAGETRPPAVLTIPLLLLAIAIGCYVASEIGVSSWLVRFLESSPVTVATGGLSLFWTGLAVGRLVGSRVVDRFDPVSFATGCALLAGVAVAAAVTVPSVPISIALFGVAGLAQGPIYPTIMTIGGTLDSRRSALVSGLLTAAAVIGGLIYPPVMGFISVSAGVGTALFGAGMLALASGVALLAAAALARRRREQAASTLV